MNVVNPKITTDRRNVELSRLCIHPDNPNKMSPREYKKLKGIIERTGVHPTIIVRTLELSQRFASEHAEGLLQVIDGRHRRDIDLELGRTHADVDIWSGVDDAWMDLYLADLNRLNGVDDPRKRAALLERLKRGFDLSNDEMAEHFVPETQKELDKLQQLASSAPIPLAAPSAEGGPRLMSIFVTPAQEEIIKSAIERRQQYPMEQMEATAMEGAALANICAQWMEGL